MHRFRLGPTRLLIGIGALVCITLAAGSASAQDDRFAEVSAGYLNVGGLMHGWSVEVSKPFTPQWALVGEVNRARGRDCQGCDPTYNDTSVLGGVRYRWLRGARIWPSAQVLVGGLHSVADGYWTDLIFGPRFYEEGYTVNYFAIQPGGGVTVMLTPRVGIRTHVDLQFAVPNQAEYEGFSIFPRVLVGGVFRFGTGH